MNCALNFAFANEEESLIIKEDYCGKNAQGEFAPYKPSIDERIFTVGPVGFLYEQEFMDDEQVRSTASRYSQIKGRKMPGDWNANTYVKPSGTPAAAPEHDVLFECLMGAGGASGVTYEYTLGNQLDSFSLWTKKGHTVFAFRGATVEQAEFGISGEAIGGIGWSGKYMEQHYAGTIVSVSASGTTVILPVHGTERYTTGMYIFVGADTNGGAGYRITAVNHQANTLTITPTLQSDPSACGSTPEISPWWPTGGTEVGTPVHGKMGIVKIGNADTVILSARVTVVNNIKYYINEKNDRWTAERFGRPKVREIDGELELFFLKAGPSYFYRAAYQVSNVLSIPVGNVSGYTMELYIPYAEYRTPKITGDEEFIQNIPFIAVADSVENEEMKIVFS